MLPLDQQDDLAVAQQWRERAGGAFLEIAAGRQDDDVGAVDGGLQGRADERDRGKAAAVDIEAARAPAGR